MVFSRTIGGRDGSGRALVVLLVSILACGDPGALSGDVDAAVVDAAVRSDGAAPADGRVLDAAGEDATVEDAGADARVDANPMGLLPLQSCAFSESSALHATPSTPRPGYLVPTTDPTFGTEVTRVTGDPGTPIGSLGASWADVARHGYSKRAAWNADGSLLYLNFDVPVFLDGESYEPIMLANRPVDMTEDRWHPFDPAVRVYVHQNRLGDWNVRTGAHRLIETFAGYSGLHMGPWEGNLSLDGQRVVLLGQSPAGRQVAFAYDMATGTRHPDVDLEGVDVDWASISPQGGYIVVNGWNDNTQVYRLDGTPVGGLWAERGVPSHYDLAVGSDGEEVAVGSARSGEHDGRVVARRLRDGAITVLTPGGYATHTSTRNLAAPGWAYVTYSYRGPNWEPYWGEVVAVPLDGSQRVRRLAHLHSGNLDYTGQPQAVPSFDGRKVLFASDWEAGPRPVGAYVVDTRPLCEPTP